MSEKLCIVCGFGEYEVEKMHKFPTNEQKSKIWQESMGMVYVPGVSLRNYNICSRHFSEECYRSLLTRKLLTNAIPRLFPCTLQTQETIMEVSDIIELSRSTNTDELVTEDPIPSCSGLQERTTTPVSHPRFRGIEDVSYITTTPKKQRLIRMVKSKEAHIRKLKRVCKQKAHNIKALTNLEESPVVKNLFKGMSSTTADFLISHLRCARRAPHGRRWTTQEKVISLALLKKSPRCYNLLRRIVVLPSKNTLLTMLRKVPFQSGINNHLFKHIAESVKREEDKFCALLFDEMDIKEHLQYDSHYDCIMGFEDGDEDNPSKKLANKALVFMVQGLLHNWKQPVAFYFSSGPCPANKLKNRITNVFEACVRMAGLDVVTLICDMGSTNVKALKEMGSSVEHPYITIGDKKIYTMYDPPHLLKCTVSLFRKHNVLVPVEIADSQQMMEARFNDIVHAYKIDQKAPLIFRAMHKIKEVHLAPKMQYTMKVNIAAQLMSHTVAAFLYSLLSRGELEQRSLATATFLKQVDNLFDIFNGSRASPPDGKDVKCCVTEQSAHIKYWREAFNMVKKWQFRRITSTGNIRSTKPPSQVGWLTSLNAIKHIWEHLHSNGATSLRPRSLNQDALENLFGSIRGGCGSGDNPTVEQFMGSLKTQILNGLTQQKIIGTNCEDDDNHLLTNLTQFLHVEEEEVAGPSSQANITEKLNDNAEAIAIAVREGSTATLSVAYVSGFIAKKILELLNCDTCANELLSNSDTPHNLYITFREWSDTNHLQYPSESLVVAVGQAITELEYILENICNRSKIACTIVEHIMNVVNFSWVSCETHKEIIIRQIARAIWKIGIPWWCKRKNQENLRSRKSLRESKRKIRTFLH